MKYLFTLFLLSLTSIIFAQAPQSIPYQAVIRNPDGSVMANSSISITFKIHDATATGNVVYEESHATTTNPQGLISLNVGNGVVVSGTFSGVNWGLGNKFLHVLMNAGNGAVDLGTQQMMSVPYSFFSEKASNGVEGFSNSGDTLYLANGSYIIIPGLSAANNNSSGVYGCTDNTACNYNSTATQSDNSCLYPNSICDDGNSATTNDIINSNCQCQGTSNTNPQIVWGGGVTDIDGNIYLSVIINGQEWMQKNLAVTKYRNGDPIPTGLSSTAWQSTSQGTYDVYGDVAANNSVYGKLYNIYAVSDSRGLCPTGWHVPTDVDWTVLINFLDPGQNPQANGQQSGIAGGILKSADGWISPNTSTNDYGFSALPGGYRNQIPGTYYGLGTEGYWWSSTASWSRKMVNIWPVVNRAATSGGYSVRCIKD
jgi:uncharacterized protein (TIGR02145 family)